MYSKRYEAVADSTSGEAVKTLADVIAQAMQGPLGQHRVCVVWANSPFLKPCAHDGSDTSSKAWMRKASSASVSTAIYLPHCLSIYLSKCTHLSF